MELSVERQAEPPVRHAAPVPVRDDTFEAFYRVQADRVYRALAVTLADQQLAREATDEAMARAYARWDALIRLDNPGGWVYRVGLNWATSWWRKVRRERQLTAGVDRADLAHAGAAGALEALSGLSVEQRAVIVCRVLLDLSTAQTAETLGVAQGTVKSRLARALKALRTTVAEEGDEDA
jgi:RNA polymerase sigma-70 factor (ECF subfamily)